MPKTKGLYVSETKVIDSSVIPNGRYEGRWGGYKVKLTIDGAEYEITTEMGIRTPSAVCWVDVTDEGITISI